MKTRWWTYTHDDLEYYRFSVYRFGSNMQTVYAFRMGEILIDTGQSNSRRNVKAALNGHSIHSILLTHHHEDHTGNVAYLKYKHESEVKAHPICADRMTNGFTVSPLGRVISGNVAKAKVEYVLDGEVLDFGRYTLQAIYTPGHTDDHMAYYEPNKGWLFSGDLFVADRIKYFESNEDIKVQIESLKKMVALDFNTLLCSHNPQLKKGKERLSRKLELFVQFYGEVLRLNKKGLSETEILKSLGRKENYYYKFMTIGHFTAVNMVKSVLKSEGIKYNS